MLFNTFFSLSISSPDMFSNALSEMFFAIRFNLSSKSLPFSVKNIKEALRSFGSLLEKKFKNHRGNIAEGFVTATLIFCIAMSIVGAIESGVSNNNDTLFAKSVLDGISAIIFSSTLGIGVSLSAVVVLIYQGSITLLAGLVANYISMEAITELSAVGGLLVFILGMNVLEITKIKVGNMLPAMFIPVVYFSIMRLIG